MQLVDVQLTLPLEPCVKPMISMGSPSGSLSLASTSMSTEVSSLVVVLSLPTAVVLSALAWGGSSWGRIVRLTVPVVCLPKPSSTTNVNESGPL